MNPCPLRPRDAFRVHGRRLAAVGLALCLTSGCGRLGEPGLDVTRHATTDQSPEQPRTVMELEPLPGGIPILPPDPKPAVDDALTTAPTGETREGNPAAWGESGRMAIGRTFDPITFDAGSAELDRNGQRLMDREADWLREHPNIWLVLTGHASGNLTPAYSYNLGMARAFAVRDYLLTLGLERNRLYCISYGADIPASAPIAGQADPLNDRVELLPFVAPAGVEAPAAVAATGRRTPSIEPPVAPPQAKILP